MSISDILKWEVNFGTSPLINPGCIVYSICSHRLLILQQCVGLIFQFDYTISHLPPAVTSFPQEIKPSEIESESDFRSLLIA